MLTLPPTPVQATKVLTAEFGKVTVNNCHQHSSYTSCNMTITWTGYSEGIHMVARENYPERLAWRGDMIVAWEA